MNTENTPTETYLRHVRDMREQSLRNDYYYIGFEDFVLQEGKPMIWAPKPKGVAYGQVKQCFMNAAHLADRHPERYVYCEGYATSILPMYHAWCWDLETERVVDVTWRESWTGETHGHEPEHRNYYGVKFTLKVHDQLLLLTERYGIIDAWESKWPLLREKMPDLWDTTQKGVETVDFWLARVATAK